MKIENITTVEDSFLALTNLIKNGYKVVQNNQTVTGIELHFSVKDAKYIIKVYFGRDYTWVSANNIIKFNSCLISVKDTSFNVSIKQFDKNQIHVV